MASNTVKAIRNLMIRLNRNRKSKNNVSASNLGYIGMHNPGNNEQHVNRGRFTVTNQGANNRIIMNFVPNNRNNRTNIKFRKKGNGGVEYAWKWPNMVNWSPWNNLQSNNRTLYPNIRPVRPSTPRR